MFPLLCAFNETLAERHASKPQPSKAGCFLDIQGYTAALAGLRAFLIAPAPRC